MFMGANVNDAAWYLYLDNWWRIVLEYNLHDAGITCQFSNQNEGVALSFG